MTCCYTKESNDCNDEIGTKRLIHSAKKTDYWQIRQKTGAIEAILQPSQSQSTRLNDFSNISICAAVPGGVVKTTSKIKYGNESSSRYHKNCVPSKPKPKRMRSTVKRSITTDSCIDCDCAKNKGTKFKNECYCSNPPNRPTLPGHPECTVPPPEYDSFVKCDDKSYPYRPETLQLAKDIIDYIPQSTFLSRMYRANCKKCLCNSCVLNAAGSSLKCTERRLNLENAYHKLAECNRINFDKLSNLNCVNICGLNISPVPSVSSTSCCSTQTPNAISDDDGCVRRSCLSRNKSSNEQISTTKSIRKQCYFETHSKTNFSTASECNTPFEEHKCIFKYTIDDRGLLAPLNPDANGTNRCSICNKAPPTTNSITQLSTEENKKHHKKKKSKTRDETKHETKHDKAPKQITVKQPLNISTQTIKQLTPKTSHTKKNPKSRKPLSTVEPPLKAYFQRPFRPYGIYNQPPEKACEFDLRSPTIHKQSNCSNARLKYMAPINTWALRYQKGCSA